MRLLITCAGNPDVSCDAEPAAKTVVAFAGKNGVGGDISDTGRFFRTSTDLRHLAACAESLLVPSFRFVLAMFAKIAS